MAVMRTIISLIRKLMIIMIYNSYINIICTRKLNHLSVDEFKNSFTLSIFWIPLSLANHGPHVYKPRLIPAEGDLGCCVLDKH